MKANREMTQPEFNYTYACKRMMNDIAILEHDLEQAKTVGMQGLSKGALIVVEHEISILKAAVINALKTVGT
jgi:hypothetical protein